MAPGSVGTPPEAAMPLSTADMIQKMLAMQGQQGDAEAPNPDEALRMTVARQELRQTLSDQFEVLKQVYPQISREQFNELRLAEVQGDIAKAEKIRFNAAKRSLEFQAEKSDADDKDLHTEGAGRGKGRGYEGAPASMEEAAERAYNRVRNK
jgi:hypothetical protein